MEWFRKKTMKITFRFLLLLCFLFVSFACKTSNTSTGNIQRQWMLVEFGDFTRDFLIAKRANLDLTDTARPTAKMGCNQMFMKALFKNDKTVKFSDLGSTMMYCDDAMKLEEAFAHLLPTMIKFSIEGHRLTLTSQSGKQMKFVAADWD